MISKNQVKLTSALHHKKFRKEFGQFIAEGEKICHELVDSGWTIHSVFMTQEFQQRKFSTWENKVSYELVTTKELEKISAFKTPQEILIVAEIPEKVFHPAMLKNELTLMLDDIRDPGNIGTIIRIADWFGIKNIICSATCADAFNPKAVQATMGSLFRVNIFYQDLIEVLKAIIADDIPVYGTFLEGENIYQSALGHEGVIVIGSESHGISNDLKPLIGNKISIPAFSAGAKKAESLNAAMAAAIVCSEFRRR